MKVAFDLVSDLHLDTWPTDFDWSHCATSAYCIVAGDIAADRNLLIKALTNLGQNYQAVFYIDGNDEHLYHYNNLSDSYRSLVHSIGKIPNVVYLQDSVVVVDGIGILGTNGWWGYDFELDADPEHCQQWWQQRYSQSAESAKKIARLATEDASYMIRSIGRLQKHRDVDRIVMVTHTVPYQPLIQHDCDLENSMKFNVMGNRDMIKVLAADTHKKIHTWCFGHYHGSVDQTHHGIRFVNNCRGRHGTTWSKFVYHPLRLEI